MREPAGSSSSPTIFPPSPAAGVGATVPGVLLALARSTQPPRCDSWGSGAEHSQALLRALSGESAATRINTSMILGAVEAGADPNSCGPCDPEQVLLMATTTAAVRGDGDSADGGGSDGSATAAAATVTALQAACTWWWEHGADYQPLPVVRALLRAGGSPAAAHSAASHSALYCLCGLDFRWALGSPTPLHEARLLMPQRRSPGSREHSAQPLPPGEGEGGEAECAQQQLLGALGLQQRQTARALHKLCTSLIGLLKACVRPTALGL
jgi:hypothetical protein